MINVLRSELVRLRRRGLLIAWLGLTALFAVLINIVMFRIVAHTHGTPTNGPGTTFPTLAKLRSADGLGAGPATAGSFFGVITLAFWAITAATDYSTGLIRVLASAQPSRWKLLAGKLFALMLWTAAATVLAVIITTVVAPIGAHAVHISTAAWHQHPLGTLARDAIDLYASLIVCGTIGLVLATLTRSSAIAISSGVAYVLILEPIIIAAAKNVGDWLPGHTLRRSRSQDRTPRASALTPFFAARLLGLRSNFESVPATPSARQPVARSASSRVSNRSESSSKAWRA